MSSSPAYPSSSHGQILRASSIIAAASLFTIAFGLVRVKMAAILLGATGIGLIGLLQNILQVAAVIGGLSLQIVGARHIADAAANDALRLAGARRTLAVLVAGLALATGVAFWLARKSIAAIALGSAGQSGMIGWLTVGVVFSIGLCYQTAVLTGLRKMGDIARSSVLSAAAVTLVAIISLLVLGKRGILPFVLATPICTFVVGYYFMAHHKPAQTASIRWRGDVTGLVKLGTALTIATIFSIVGQLVVKVMMKQDLGLAAVGYFQAAWFISITYLSFVLQAMGSDFFPRLTSVSSDKDLACRIINEQTEVALLLAAPILTAMLALTPLLIGILYTSQFAVAASILRWQILGDLLKIVSWPLGLTLVVYSDGKRYILAEATTVAILTGGTAAMLPFFGLEAGGISVLLMNLWYLPLIYFLVQHHLHFRWTINNLKLFASIATICLVTFGVSSVMPMAGALAGCIFSFGLTAFALHRLETALPAQIASVVVALRKRLFQRHS